MIPPDSAKNQKNVYHIGGIPVEFPYQPYGSQLAFMGRVISTLDRAQREGHCHSLLESPTGTGKSLSLLCSALAWQRSYRSRNLSGNPAHLKPAPEAYTDPIGHGGGFVPESQPSASGNPEPAASATKTPSKKKTIPTIFYASRTHTQITQVIREYRKTTYRVPMAVLASRKHYCTNRHIHGKDNIDEECKLLLSNQEVGCPNFKNVHKVKGHQSLKKGGCYEVHDIEDLVKLGQEMNGCSYFAARSMAEDAQLIFCPYSYVINPVIRKAMEVDIERAILVLDEAHNIEDMARDAGSVDAEEDVLHILQTELGQLTLVDPTIYQPLHEMMEGIINWMEQRKDNLGKREFQHYFSCWTGDKAMWELQEANISRQCFPILQECAAKAIRAVSDAEPDVAHLTGISATTLEGLFSSLTYFFSRNGAHIYDYQLALQRHIKRDARNAVVGWTHTLSLWCLNPAVVFKDIADLSLSVILTSGTLSPMNSFSSELGVQFGTCLEAPHVIDVESQLWAGVVSTGPGNYPLNASYKTADGYAFQDALGRSLEEICKIVPGGSLIFFPSYKLMEKLCNRWRETGQWSRLNARKPLFVEPRGGSQDDFEGVLNGYYDSIRGSKNPALGRKRRGKKLGLKNCDATECTGNSNKGAAFLAVCRGKVSEGIDFSDEKARVVIIVGIPFPNINDIQVAQKKKYNDTYKSSRNLLSGNEWYCHQAFRALNQAAGRCIRHRFDYGAVILLDERYREERNIMYISKWLKKSIRHYDSFDKSLEELKSFFREVKKCLGKEADSISQNSDADVGIFSVPEQNKGFIIKKNKKVNKSHNCGQKLFSDHMMAVDSASRLCPSPICVENYDASFTQSKSVDDLEIQELRLPIGIYGHSSREYVDLDCSFQENLRCSGPLSIKVSHDDSDVTVIQETPVMDVSHNLAHPGSFCKDENCSSTITQDHPEFRDQLVLHTSSPTNSYVAASKSTNSLVTPEKNGTIDTNSLLAETESALNLSVNSHSQKRRKSIGSTLVNLVEVERFDAPCPCQSPSGHASFTSSSIISNDENKFKTPSFSNFPSVKISLNHVKNEGLQICCSFCRNTLGLPENNYLVRCSITSSSKIYLTTLLKGKCEATTENMSSIPVLISDTSSVDQQLYNRTQEGTAGQGIWCWEDGCVFNPIFCPFCRNPNNCLGSQIVAADASNIQLLNKILFYRDRLEIKGPEASEEKGKTPAHVSDNGNCAAPISIEKFSYVPQQKKSDGWRTTKSKMRLPKRGASYGGLR